MYGAAGEARRGEQALRDAEQALRAEDPQRAHARLTDARPVFASAAARLGSPLTLPARIVPGVGRQIRAARDLARAGEQLTVAGIGAAEGLEARPAGGWRVRGGRVDLDALERLRGTLVGRVLPPTAEASRILEASPSGFLAAPIEEARAEALERVRGVEEGTRRAIAGLEVLPGLLGADGPRRYLLAFANLGELRGTGGFLGYFGIVHAEDGSVERLADTGRPTRELVAPDEAGVEAPDWYRRAYARYGAFGHWANANLTSDFPTVGSILTQTIPDELGAVDGVIQIDPPGAAALLELAGPVEVAGWDEPVTAGNVHRIAEHDMEVRFAGDGDARREFLTRLVETVFDHALASDIEIRGDGLERLGEAVAGGHIQVYSTRPREQEVLEEIGIARGVERARGAGDVLGLVTQNAIGNKIDWFLRREIAYDVTLDPETGAAHARLEVILRNEAPTSGYPSRVIGSRVPGLGEGWNRQITVLLRPPEDTLGEIRLDGESIQVSGDRERDLRAYHRMIEIPPGAEVLVEASFTVPDALGGEGRHRSYELHLLRQPIAHPDVYRVGVEAPEGWRVEGQATRQGHLTEDVTVSVDLTQTVHAWAFETAVLRPYRLARNLIGRLF